MKSNETKVLCLLSGEENNIAVYLFKMKIEQEYVNIKAKLKTKLESFRWISRR